MVYIGRCRGLVDYFQIFCWLLHVTYSDVIGDVSIGQGDEEYCGSFALTILHTFVISRYSDCTFLISDSLGFEIHTFVGMKVLTLIPGSCSDGNICYCLFLGGVGGGFLVKFHQFLFLLYWWWRILSTNNILVIDSISSQGM